MSQVIVITGATSGLSRALATADQWTTRAIPLLLKLSAKDNGKSLTARRLDSASLGILLAISFVSFVDFAPAGAIFR